MKVLVIDNIDSFTYNLVQYLGELGAELVVKRNDISIDEMKRIKPDKILLSPGPGHPKDSKATIAAIKDFGKDTPVLGVCLGHQAIGLVFGGKIELAKNLLHGKTSLITHDGRGIFEGIKNPFEATRYHSLVIAKDNFPGCLEIAAESQGEIMAVRHKEYPITGVQFHPESVLTAEGKKIMKNWVMM